MKNLLEQLEQGINAGLYYLTLFVALSIPDICGALESKNGQADSKKYKDWFNQYVASKYNGRLSGDDCYYFRCSLLHQGSSQHDKSNYSRIIFLEPTSNRIFHNNIVRDALNIDVRIFCIDIINGVHQWLKKVESTELYKKNYDKFIKRHPDGLELYIQGISVVA